MVVVVVGGAVVDVVVELEGAAVVVGVVAGVDSELVHAASSAATRTPNSTRIAISFTLRIAPTTSSGLLRPVFPFCGRYRTSTR
jgi:hypothetical protein